MSTPPPLPSYDSPRLIGIELEFDAGSMPFRLPTLPQGWLSKTDGSLGNGKEVVLRNPIPVNAVYRYIKALSNAVTATRTGINRRGGFHVHVGGEGWDVGMAFRTVKLYSRYQTVINALVGESRVNNRFAQPYRDDLTQAGLIQMYCLDRPAATREVAKSTRVYSVVNVAAVRCSDPLLRSVEFRQASPSRNAANIWGWVCFVTAIVDLSATANAAYAKAMSGYPVTLEGCVAMLKDFEATSGVKRLSDWVLWRYQHMHELPSPIDDYVDRCVEFCMAKPRGFVAISNKVGLAYPQTRLLLQHAISHGALALTDNKYNADYTPKLAAADLSYMLEHAVVHSVADTGALEQPE